MFRIGRHQLVSRAVGLQSDVVVVERFPNRDFTPIRQRMVSVDDQNQPDRSVLNSFEPVGVDYTRAQTDIGNAPLYLVHNGSARPLSQIDHYFGIGQQKRAEVLRKKLYNRA